MNPPAFMKLPELIATLAVEILCLTALLTYAWRHGGTPLLATAATGGILAGTGMLALHLRRSKP